MAVRFTEAKIKEFEKDDGSDEDGDGDDGVSGAETSEDGEESGDDNARSNNDDDDDEDEDDEDDSRPPTREEVEAKKRLTMLLVSEQPRAIGPVEELISVGNRHYSTGDYAVAIRLYTRAMEMIKSSGKEDCHEDFISCCLNLGETYLHVDDFTKAQQTLAPALLKLDTEGAVSSAQQTSALILLTKDARVWWRSIFPPEPEAKAKKKKKKAGKKAGKAKGSPVKK